MERADLCLVAGLIELADGALTRVMKKTSLATIPPHLPPAKRKSTQQRKRF